MRNAHKTGIKSKAKTPPPYCLRCPIRTIAFSVFYCAYTCRKQHLHWRADLILALKPFYLFYRLSYEVSEIPFIVVFHVRSRICGGLFNLVRRRPLLILVSLVYDICLCVRADFPCAIFGLNVSSAIVFSYVRFLLNGFHCLLLSRLSWLLDLFRRWLQAADSDFYSLQQPPSELLI